ncbi:glycosyltransferase family 4 protein [Aliarcobacter butzleri]|uniref:glycosyltransferase family 4 protein n=1 Tax=Aliarcobacter butzleri TaxID=28197 RepID=UPI001EDD9040|nr:glycosyltransferase family 4 protein [Aliarcobacter butzleri]MCG3697538.1 glycosyltransferase family 4 protein [Aliarcobacter butzleri]MCG3698942.1 glycosyltransferase family 4 protein [Aliarcobacter butzleri]MCT7619666.1 glycosyltransferase family 4 protein [Aliarcobacter butzleri]MDN5091632.1 glycosyltransferase family 4 protein [Aliarcobacter butzleri]
MKILYCWDVIEHLAARQIESMLKENDDLFFIVLTKFVPNDYEVKKILANKRIKLFKRITTKSEKINSILYLLMYIWVFMTKKFDLIDVKMAQSREMKNISLLNILFKKEYILNMLGKERHIEDEGFFSNEEKHQIVSHIKKAKKIVCVDQTLVNLTLKYRNDKKNIIKLWNSQNNIDISNINKSDIKRKFNIENKKVILFNHRLLKSKRPFLFFEFVEKILDKRDDVVIVIVSIPKEEDVTIRMNKLIDKYKNILWLGKNTRLNFEELKELFAISDVGINIATLVVPSLATLEAMAAGVPQVISNEIDSEAYVKDGINGYILKNLSADELLEKIENIINNKELRNQMSKNCISIVSKNFSQKNWAKKMMEVYYV